MEAAVKMTAKEYEKELRGVDWYYFMSSDSRVNREGQQNWRRVEAIAKDSGDPELIAMFEREKRNHRIR